MFFKKTALVTFLFTLLVALSLSGGAFAQNTGGAGGTGNVDLNYVGDDINDLIAEDISSQSPADERDDSLLLDDGFLDATTSPPQEVPADEAAAEKAKPIDENINPNAIRSLLFSGWEYAAIADAIAARGLVDPDLYKNRLEQTQERQEEDIGPTIRELRLGGILYTSADDWTIWLNGQRLMPGTLPDEILSLDVFNNYIEMKWLDPKTMQIYPVRLRPNQRFNIDRRLFLPG